MAILDEIIGNGWCFPILPDSRGRLGYVTGQENIEQSLHLILLTNLRERVMRADFGTDAREQLFAPGSEKVLRLVESSVAAAIRDHEPRIEILDLSAEADPRDQTHLLVLIDYEVRATYERGNLVFPFYLAGGGAGTAS
jgi:phage baseplate assembly protein W